MSARVLLYDLEVSPMLGWAYDRWDTRLIHVEHESFIMCFAWKWLDEKKVHTFTAKNRDDLELCELLHSLMDEADIVVAHNADRFDNRVANARFLYHRLTPPAPYKTVDTLKAARRHFKYSSNSLNNLCSMLDIGCKSKDTHSDLWRSCLDGDEKAWRKMLKYNKQDVILLEELYLTLRPYISNHPNVTVYDEVDGCPKCGSPNTRYRGYETTRSLRYRRVYCNDCGAWSRERASDGSRKPSLV
jgi:hypothetical protein